MVSTENVRNKWCGKDKCTILFRYNQFERWSDTEAGSISRNGSHQYCSVRGTIRLVTICRCWSDFIHGLVADVRTEYFWQSKISCSWTIVHWEILFFVLSSNNHNLRETKEKIFFWTENVPNFIYFGLMRGAHSTIRFYSVRMKFIYLHKRDNKIEQ